jgi:restriction system protein
MAPHIAVELERPDADVNPIVPCLDQAAAEAEAVRSRRNSYHEYKLDQLQNILRAALDAKHAIDLESFKHNDPYSEPEPQPARYLDYPREPQPDDTHYQVSSGPGVTPGSPPFEQKQREAYEVYVRIYTAWAETVKKVEAENQKRYAAGVAAVERWNGDALKHRQVQAAYNEAIDRRKADYQAWLPEAVEDYCRQVLAASPLPDGLRREFDLQYFSETKTLLVEHLLPLPEGLPRVKGRKYIKTRDEFVEVLLSATALNRLYADVVHQICLRTIHELFDADLAGALGAVVFSGWAEATDATTGEKTRRCVAAVQAGKGEFQALNLWDTDAKANFKALKGVAAAKLHTLAPVTPMLRIQR